ncbi:MAG: hypothetical protein HQK81_12330 [Desulfovibrionaceae bacterium]|nr:hypothetical protein [Desulfovibrionaceae bacterium]MBF0514830.1 hypothetical protein [Desulfovibrionaceae bacterium]
MNYLAIATSVLSSISQAGVAMSIQKTQVGAFDPETGKKDTTGVLIPCMAIIDKYSSFMVNGTSVLSDDQRVYVAAAGLAAPPAAGDKLIMGSNSWNIVRATPIQPGGVPLLYDLQVRQ